MTTVEANKSKRFDAVFILLVLLLVGATRIPLAAKSLHHYDSVVFALAMEDYNPTPGGAPHPPGYLFYIGVAKLFRGVLTGVIDYGDVEHLHAANDALIFTSIVFELLTVVVLYRFCLEAFSRTYGVVACLALLCSPLFWFYGEVALSYPVESFFGVLVALHLYRAAAGSTRALYLGAAAIAIAGGFRTSAMIMLMPLLLYVIVLRHRKLKKIAVVIGLMMALVLTWLIPSIHYGGGLNANGMKQYFDYSTRFWKPFLETTSILYGAGLTRFAKQLLLIAETCFSALWFFAPLVLDLHFKRGIQWWFQSFRKIRADGFRAAWTAGTSTLAAAARRNDPFLFIAVIIVPAIVNLSLLHFSQRGHIFLFLPFLFIPIVRSLEEYGPPTREKRRIFVALALGCSLNITAFFVVHSARTMTFTSEARNGLYEHAKFRIENNLNNWILNTSLSEIRKHDQLLKDFDKIRAHYTPESAVIVTKYDRKFSNLFTQSFYQYVRYYMPEYYCYQVTAQQSRKNGNGDRHKTLKMAHDRKETKLAKKTVELKEGTHHVIWYIAREIISMSRIDNVTIQPEILHHGDQLRVSTLTEGQPIHFSGHDFVVSPRD